MSFFKKLVKKDKDGSRSPKASKGSPTSTRQPNSPSTNDDEIEKFDEENMSNANMDMDAPEDKKRLWSRVSGLIGKDTMSLVSLPVYFFEPITVLQAQVEPLRFVHLIEKACEMENSLDRMCYITAFNISLFSSYVRTAKPFNPLLGETFEYIPKEGNYRTICEQVSHHPPIGIAETTSSKFRLQQESHITTKFWGNSVDIFSQGNNHLYLLDHDDYYSWKVPASCCHNILLGRMWVEHHGTLSITNHKTGEKAIINFSKSSWFDGSTKKITGEIFDSLGRKRFLVNGKWNECVIITKLDDRGTKCDEFTIWKAQPDPEIEKNKWKLCKFIQSFNEMSEDYESILPPTDSRLRPDRKYLEYGENKLANREKAKIEERERAKRKERELSGKKWEPKYFKRVDDPNFGSRWCYLENYWDQREQRINKFRLNRSLKDLSITDITDSDFSPKNPKTLDSPKSKNIEMIKHDNDKSADQTFISSPKSNVTTYTTVYEKSSDQKPTSNSTTTTTTFVQQPSATGTSSN
ncbi:oxysterol binding family protein [Cavenderia fasciculata]|uniref:Oxysterol binding family protein n=1 Tax=Cavenderia fasciculata TaxID=261658 RepID=F4Q696_CACFS|nr:oxysterol binding family protein [Cavenderia fasciculata]EGG17470.1 oxysterol binding family protein [Cavenderia fasciculata]|eukprot:XP_004355954.1 oxysterol binding family protein [Cavenderia fasciculata]